MNDNPIRAASRELVQFNERLGVTRDRLLALETAAGKTTINMTKLSDVIGSGFGSVAVRAIEGAVVAMGALGLAIWKIGDFAQEAFGERQGTLRAYTTLLGSATDAAKEFGKAQDLAAKTDLTMGDSMAAQKALMVAGFRGKDLDRALLTTADMAAMATPKERGMMSERSGRALAQILAKGKLQGEEVRQLTEAGFSRGKLNQELIKLGFGKDAAGVEKAISAGKVSADVGIPAIQRALLAQFGTQKLGQYAIGASGSLSALESNKDDAMKKLFMTIDSELLPETKNYKRALTDNAMALDASTGTGGDLRVMFQDLAGLSFDMKAGWTDFSTAFLASFSESWDTAIGEMDDGGAAFKSTTVAVIELGEWLGKAGGAIRSMISVLEAIPGFFREAKEDLAKVAAAPIDWLFNGDKAVPFQYGEDWRDKTKAKDSAQDWARNLPYGDKRTWTDAPSWQTTGGDTGDRGGDTYTVGPDGKTYHNGELYTPPKKAEKEARKAMKAIGSGGGGKAASSGGGGSGPSDGIGWSPGGDTGAAMTFGNIEIKVESHAASAGDVAQEVYATFMREMGRFTKTPSPRVR